MTTADRVVGIDAGALMLRRTAPGTAKFVFEQTAELLARPVPWRWIVAVPAGLGQAFGVLGDHEIVELPTRKYSVFATVATGRLWRRRGCALAFSPAGMSAFFSPLVSNYFDSNLFEYGRAAVASSQLARYYFLRWMAVDTFRRARIVFVNSTHCADVLRSRFPAYREKFVANPVGITPVPPVEAERPTWATERLDAEGSILCSSAFMDNKNQRRLIDAYVALQRSGRALPPLVLIGPCPPDYFASVIRPAISASPRPEEIIAPGHVTDGVLAWAFAHARVVVQPSFAEGFSSFSVFQAMQRRVPVACSNTSSHPEAVGEAAHLFDPSSVPSIATAVGRLLDDQALRARLVEAGVRRVAELTWTANADRVCEAMSRVVEEPRV